MPLYGILSYDTSDWLRRWDDDSCLRVPGLMPGARTLRNILETDPARHSLGSHRAPPQDGNSGHLTCEGDTSQYVTSYVIIKQSVIILEPSLLLQTRHPHHISDLPLLPWPSMTITHQTVYIVYCLQLLTSTKYPCASHNITYCEIEVSNGN